MDTGSALRIFVTGEVSRIRSGPKTDWRYDLAERFKMLPIAADASGALFLRDDGQVFTMGWTAGEVPRICPDAQAFLPTLQHFVEKHPEARPLLELHKKNARQDIVMERTRGSK